MAEARLDVVTDEPQSPTSSTSDSTDLSLTRFHRYNVDLIGDYAGSEFFIIDGDSLLRWAFKDDRIDFERGWQVLHAVYVVENFLVRARRRRCEFAVVFLDYLKDVSIPPSAASSNTAHKYALAREAIITHLQTIRHPNSSTSGTVHRFQSLNDKSFRNFLDETRPLFVMADNGEDIGDKGQEEEEEVSEEEKVKREELRGLVTGYMRLGFNVALLQMVEFRENKVFTDVCQLDQIREIDYLHIEGDEEEASPEPSELKRVDSLDSLKENLAVLTLSKLLQQKNDDSTKNLAARFLLHVGFLEYLPLSQRRFPAIPAEAVDAAEKEFFASVAEIAGEILRSSSVPEGLVNDVADFVDGRLFSFITEGTTIPDSVSEKLKVLSEAVKTESGIELPSPTLPPPVAVADKDKPTEPSQESFKLLPFSHPSFNDYLAKVKLSSDGILPANNPIDEEEKQRETYWETHHWHNAKKPLGQSNKPKRVVVQKTGKGQGVDRKEKREAGRARKWEQIYLNQMYQYASSLTGGINGAIDPKLVLVQEAAKKVGAPKKAMPEKKTSGPGKKLPAKGKGGTAVMKADEIRKINNEKKTDEISKKLNRTWLAAYSKPLPNSEDMLVKINDWMKANKPKADDEVAMDVWAFIEVEARLYKVYLLQKIWINFCMQKRQDEGGYQAVAELFHEARTILASKGLTVKVYEILRDVFAGLKIKLPPAPPVETLPKKKLSGAFDKWNYNVAGVDLSLKMSSEEFQLLHYGPLMDRNMDSKPDPRVSFEPDAWQRKVLDELDEDNSVFVVAPTSAGKTFIAFYAMEKVLKADDEGILVYVAPTKALVNQIAAEVISRFKKNYNSPGKTVWAIHTRDYRVNEPLKCQILVTVPHILQIMLMSPANAAKWSPRVKRIIFDEVHSIGNAEDGVVWEQLLLLAPCPIIALSATVGNPKEFSDWLETTQKGLGKKLTHIDHPYRYSDLRKYIHVTKPGDDENTKPATKRTSKFVTLDNNPNATYVHPLAAVQDGSRALPSDLSFEPKDSFLAYKAMVDVATPEFPVPNDLDYKKFFGTSGKVIRKADTVVWETKLKEHLESWMRARDQGAPFAQVVKKLSVSKEIEVSGDSERYLKRTILSLLRSLDSSNALPAIIFNYNRTICEKLCYGLVKKLVQDEEEYRATDAGFKKRLKEYEARLKSKSKAPRKPVIEKGVGKDEMARDSAESALEMTDNFDPNDPLPLYSFADMRMHSKNELEKDCASLARWGIREELVEALKRGVGVHHAGMNRKYRQAVEMLFRKGFLRVIIATGTLALGINMPTRTTVFAGDSIFLTALNYRQAAGRAGRRGFDNLGNVVFHGLSKSEVLRLMSSKLPSLQGHFPISTSLVLRSFILLHNSGESEYAKRMVTSLISQSRLVLGGNAYEAQVLHHLRFSIEFLRRQRLLSADGTPLNFAGMITHLFYEEDAAFALHALLVSGYLQKVCEQVDEKPESTAQQLMLIFTHLFNREPRRGTKGLPLLPEDAAALIRDQNKNIVDIYTSYVRNYAAEYTKEADNQLPFSQQTFGVTDTTTSLPASLPGVTARSAFVALSGHSDSFHSIPDLSTGVRDSIFVSGSSIPQLPLSTTAENSPNAYLYEFYKHGDMRRVENENGIRTSDIWFKLKDFSLILAAVEAGLKCFLKEGGGTYYEVENKDEEDGEVPPTTSATGASGGAVAAEDEDDEETILGVGEDGESRWGDESTVVGGGRGGGGGGGYEKVWKGVRLCQIRFEEKFKAMWA